MLTLVRRTSGRTTRSWVSVYYGWRQHWLAVREVHCCGLSGRGCLNSPCSWSFHSSFLSSTSSSFENFGLLIDTVRRQRLSGTRAMPPVRPLPPLIRRPAHNRFAISVVLPQFLLIMVCEMFLSCICSLQTPRGAGNTGDLVQPSKQSRHSDPNLSFTTLADRTDVCKKVFIFFQEQCVIGNP